MSNIMMMHQWGRITGFAVAVGLIFGIGQLAQATTITLSDRGAIAEFDITSNAGQNVWRVGVDPNGDGGFDAMQRQWFWYRIGGGADENSIDELSSPTYSTRNTNLADPADDELTVTYQDAGLTIAATYRLRGGGYGFGNSSITESLNITNNNEVAIDLHFFQYVDINLFAPNDESSLVMSEGNTAQQTSEFGSVSESVSSPDPQGHHADNTQALLDALLDDQVQAVLNNSDGPVTGDVNWAFEWVATLDPGEVLQISKVKSVQIESPNEIPEPRAAMVLLAIGLVGLAMRPRRALALQPVR